jgi:alpha-L-fucosidase 2
MAEVSPQVAFAWATWAARPYPVHQDWSFDPVQAARLGLSDEVGSTLIALTGKYQKYINGFANWGGPAGEFYVEQEGVVALALAEALVQDYDGLIRVAPAVPHAWDFEGSVWVRNRTRVDVQTRAGVPDTVVIEAGASETLAIRNPWPGKSVEVTDANGKTPVRSTGSILQLPVSQGNSYLLGPAGTTTREFVSISGEASQQPKKLGAVQIGK